MSDKIVRSINGYEIADEQARADIESFNSELDSKLDKTGGTLTGALDLKPYDNGYSQLFKNNSDTADYGTVLRDFDKNGNSIGLTMMATNESLNFIDKDGGINEVITSKKIGKLLWEGTWATGSITVGGLSDYVLFAVYLSGSSTPMIGFSVPTDGVFRCFGGYANTTPNMWVHSLNANRSGNVLTMVMCGNCAANGSYNVETDESIHSIYGII